MGCLYRASACLCATVVVRRLTRGTTLDDGESQAEAPEGSKEYVVGAGGSLEPLEEAHSDSDTGQETGDESDDEDSTASANSEEEGYSPPSPAPAPSLATCGSAVSNGLSSHPEHPEGLRGWRQKVDWRPVEAPARVPVTYQAMPMPRAAAASQAHSPPPPSTRFSYPVANVPPPARMSSSSSSRSLSVPATQHGVVARDYSARSYVSTTSRASTAHLLSIDSAPPSPGMVTVKVDVPADQVPLDADAPTGSKAWACCVYESETGIVNIRYLGPGGRKVRFRTSAAEAGGSPEEALRIARLCYIQIARGASREEMERYRRTLYKASQAPRP